MSKLSKGKVSASSTDPSTDCGRTISQDHNGCHGTAAQGVKQETGPIVICDYATREPEAVPIKTMDSENMEEEL